MFVIGITGGLGSGKSTVSARLARLGAQVLDADRIVHDLLDSNGACVTDIRSVFGEDVVDGTAVNRQALAKIVFREKESLKKLEAILHPQVRQRIQQRLQQIAKGEPDAMVALDVPLLFEAGMEDMVDLTIVVTCDQPTQIARAMRSLKITRPEALLRIQSQMPLAEKAKRADMVIDNTGTKLELDNEVDFIWQKVSQIRER